MSRAPGTPPPREPLGGELRAELDAADRKAVLRYVTHVRPAFLALAAFGEAMAPVAWHLYRTAEAQKETACTE